MVYIILKTVKIELSHKVPLPSNIALWKLSVSLLNMLKCFLKLLDRMYNFFKVGCLLFCIKTVWTVVIWTLDRGTNSVQSNISNCQCCDLFQKWFSNIFFFKTIDWFLIVGA
jgi:hypothetical protein